MKLLLNIRHYERLLVYKYFWIFQKTSLFFFQRFFYFYFLFLNLFLIFAHMRKKRKKLYFFCLFFLLQLKLFPPAFFNSFSSFVSLFYFRGIIFFRKFSQRRLGTLKKFKLKIVFLEPTFFLQNQQLEKFAGLRSPFIYKKAFEHYARKNYKFFLTYFLPLNRFQKVLYFNGIRMLLLRFLSLSQFNPLFSLSKENSLRLLLKIK